MNLTPPKTQFFFRAIDYAMIPIMYILGGFKKDAMQETHPWHSYRAFDPASIDKGLAVESKGTDARTFKRHFLFLFHAPIFGGWKHYIALSPISPTTPFFIGWLVYNSNTNKIVEKGINKLPIHSGTIRTLVGPPTNTVYFFAVDKNGQQIKLDETGRGTLGDKKFPGIRLF